MPKLNRKAPSATVSRKGSSTSDSDDGNDFEKPRKPPNKDGAIKSMKLNPSGSVDDQQLAKLQQEFSDVIKKQAALSNRERKLRADIKKVERRMKVSRNVQYVVEEDVSLVKEVTSSLFRTDYPVTQAIEPHPAPSATSVNENEPVSLWKLTQQPADLDLKENSSLQLLQASLTEGRERTNERTGLSPRQETPRLSSASPMIDGCTMTDRPVMCSTYVQTEADWGTTAPPPPSPPAAEPAAESLEEDDLCVLHYEPAYMEHQTGAEFDSDPGVREDRDAATTTAFADGGVPAPGSAAGSAAEGTDERTEVECSRMSPKEIFDLPVSCVPNFAQLSRERLEMIGAQFGLKYSVNLPRILKDIWLRIRENESRSSVSGAGNTAGNKRSQKVSAPGAKNKRNRTRSEGDMDERVFVDLLKEHYSDIYERVLLFFPVDLEQIYLRLHSGGHPVSRVKLQYLLDKLLAFVSAGSGKKTAQHANLASSKFAFYQKNVKASQDSQNVNV